MKRSAILISVARGHRLAAGGSVILHLQYHQITAIRSTKDGTPSSITDHCRIARGGMAISIEDDSDGIKIAVWIPEEWQWRGGGE